MLVYSRPSRHRCAWVALWLGLLGGCPNQSLTPLAPCPVSEVQAEVNQAPVDKVDLLFVVDDSQSMEAEQATLAREVPRLVEVLTTGDLDGDGGSDFPAVDLHVGVVSTDLGAGFGYDRCDVPGRDAALVAGAPECAALVGERRFLQIDSDASRQSARQAMECLVKLGVKGCGLEQPLDAMLKALVPSSMGLSFAQGQQGQGDLSNLGFVREESLIVVVLVSDEDDCSVADFSFFGPGDTDVGLRCGLQPGSLHPVSRYLEGLRALRPGHPERVLFAAITGVPPQLVEDPEAIDYQAILDHPRMVFEPDPTASPAAPFPACELDRVGDAAPARRIVELARQFGEYGLVQSICNDDYSGALTAVLNKIRSILDVVCLPRALTPDVEGQVSCDVLELLPPGETCEAYPGRRQRGSEQGRALCEILQVGSPENTLGVGWFYEPGVQDERCAAGTGQLTFTDGAEPAPAATVSLECQQPVLPSSPSPLGLEAIGLGCGTSAEDDCTQYLDPRAPYPLRLFCETRTQTCQLACDNNADCPAPRQCDTRNAEPMCVNAACPVL